MKTKIIYALTTLLLLFTACNKDVDDGDDSDPIIMGKHTYKVAAQGANLTLRLWRTFWYNSCTRYTASDTVEFLLPFYEQGKIYTYNDTISFENITLWGNKSKLNIKIGPNDLTLDKEFAFGIQSGDHFEGICIQQEGRKKLK